MHILLTGLDHKTASLELRERVAFTADQLSDALPRLSVGVGEAVILSTCNRTEVYTVTVEPEEASALVRRVRRRLPRPSTMRGARGGVSRPGRRRRRAPPVPGRRRPRLDDRRRVSDTRPGAFRLLPQSSAAGTLSAPLSRLFHRAIRAGRRVREETGVGRNALSVSFAAVRLAQTVLGDLSGSRVLLIGAGEAGKLVAEALRKTGVGELAVTNRTANGGPRSWPASSAARTVAVRPAGRRGRGRRHRQSRPPRRRATSCRRRRCARPTGSRRPENVHVRPWRCRGTSIRRPRP